MLNRTSFLLALPCALLALQQDPVEAQDPDPLILELEEFMKAELESSSPFTRINIPHVTITRPSFVLDPQGWPFQDPIAPAAHAGAGPKAEPPLRARIQVGDEAVETILGQEAQLADGTRVRTQLLDARVFEAPGAFTLAYPRGWNFLGSVTADGGWWNLRGEGEVIYLRAHDQDADEILEQYVTNLEGGNKGTRSSLEVTVDGRELTGWSVEIEVGSIGRYEGPRRWVQEVFAWHDGTRSWLMSVQRDLGLINPHPGFQDLSKYVINLEGDLVVSAPETPAIPKAPGAGEETMRILSGMRWFGTR